MAELTNSLPGVTPSLPLSTLPAIAIEGTNPVVGQVVADLSVGAGGVAGQRAPTDFFKTDTFIGRYTIASTNTQGQSIFAIEPFQLYLANSLVQSRIRGYKFWRANLILTIVTTAPGSCYGSYTIGGTCDGGLERTSANIDSSTEDNWVTATQGLHETVNCEMLNTVQLKIPFVNARTAVPIATFSTLWRINC